MQKYFIGSLFLKPIKIKKDFLKTSITVYFVKSHIKCVFTISIVIIENKDMHSNLKSNVTFNFI